MRLPSGQAIGRYRILEHLGEGGMADVYKAFDTQLERDVAIKVIRKDAFPLAAQERMLKRFEREAKSQAKMSHPNIVKVFDYGVFKKAPFLVMEYFPGGTLKEQMGQPMLWAAAAALLVPIAKALDYAHKQGVLHRDVKPANILITAQGQPMLTDFGIAKLLQDDSGHTLTGTGMGIGTPEYMAPEQGLGKDVDNRADVYALGVVLYELVTGRKPYSDTTPMAVLLKQMNDPLPNPRDAVPDLPVPVEQIILKALAKNPEDRYADMGQFASALESLEKERFIAEPVETGKPIMTEPQKNHTTFELVEGSVTDNRPNLEISKRRKTIFRWILAVIGILGLLFFFAFSISVGFFSSVRRIFPDFSVTASPTSRLSLVHANIDLATKSSPVLLPTTYTTKKPQIPDPTETQIAMFKSPTPLPLIVPIFSVPTKTQGVSPNENGAGNITNGGLAAIQGDWIYYQNDSDGWRIYRIHPDSSGREKLNEDHSSYITVAGDWIYYQNNSDNGNTYRMHPDGSNREKVNNNSSSYINVFENWVYFRNNDDKGKIYRMHLDGSGLEKLNDDSSLYINVSNGWIYFSNDSDGLKIYRMLLDGSRKEKLNNFISNFINVTDDWIFYRNSNSGGIINRMHLDGSGIEKLNKDNSTAINVTRNWIYYDSRTIHTAGLRRMSLDGSRLENISSYDSQYINVVGDWIYSLDVNNGNVKYRMKLDGSEWEKVY